MKYADGLWLNKPGYGVNYATQMYEVTADETSINVLATNQWIGNRGMTLGGPVLEITFTSTLENTIKVSIDHYKGRVHKSPDFQLNEDKSFRPVIKETDGAYELISGNTKVVVAKGGAWDIKYYYNDKLLTKEGWRTTSYITEDQWKTNERMANDEMKPFFSHDETADGAVMREMLNISVGECLYGFGEKFSTFVKNGQTVEVWNNDGGTSSEQSYKSIPFYVSSRNYGVFVNHPEKVTFEVASETVSKVAFSVQGEHLEYFVIGGGKLTDVVSTYTTLTGWENAIVSVGDVMTSFILGDAELEDVVKIIDASQNDIVNDITETYTTVTEHIGQEDCARLVGKAFAQATGSDLALVSLGKWIPGHISTQNTQGVSGSLYPGEITEQQLCAITPTGWKDTIKTVTLTGARINELVRQGFDLYGDGKTYPYILVTKKGFSLEPDKTYKLAICGATDAVEAEGNILDSGIAGLESVEEMMSAYESFSAKDIIWE